MLAAINQQVFVNDFTANVAHFSFTVVLHDEKRYSAVNVRDTDIQILKQFL